MIIAFRRAGTFINTAFFGKRLLFLTNGFISASMGAVGDSIQQNYDILTSSLESGGEVKSYDVTRTVHMTMAGLTTGIVTHHWYHHLDRLVGIGRSTRLVAGKILLDQLIGSPLSLVTYFLTLGLCERSTWRHLQAELIEKGFERIYLAEWIIWPPLQAINFALLPLRYRILFDNCVSLGFDIYAPYVKYNTQLREEQPPKLSMSTT